VIISLNNINPLRSSGNYMNHLLWQSVTLYFVFIGFAWFSLQTAIISLNSIYQLIFVMVKCGVLFEVRTEFLNVI
jgi:D-alanyl-lipoteichoic acid acyltransferase DltB (MBOAT superfamily)